ncbi:MAG: putative transcription regulator containing domain [Phycisphaerales bacterium]|nr:putative transcription regulator containing domain [Phycisphaerales bacterium]
MSRVTSKPRVKEPDSYFELVRLFPLRPIRDAQEYDAAVAVMNQLAVRDEETLDQGEQDYLDAISTFVGVYDAQNFNLTELVTPLSALKHLMDANEMSIADLGRVIESQSAASMIFNGKRAISKSQAKALAGRFKVDAGLFL